MDAKEKIIITIGRQFGSGGRELGKSAVWTITTRNF